jgi:secreted PhoX family phosphatase
VRRRVSTILVAVVAALVAVGIANAVIPDFGTQRDDTLAGQAFQRFGVKVPLASSSTSSVGASQALADPTTLVTLAKGLSAHVVTAEAGANVDQMVLWPTASNPQYIIACNEQGVSDPGVQRITLQGEEAGTVETIVTGTTICDPVRATPWGTIVFGEENGGGSSGGRLYELIDPVGTTGVTLDRTTGVFSGGTGAENLTVRPALGRLSFEGLGILPNGVTYYADENRPSSGTAGGAYFKFVPTTLYDPSDGPITDLGDSPLASGSIFGLRLGKRSNNTDYGQGTEFGLGTWVSIPAAPDPDLRAAAASLKLTGYYRPEDMQLDPVALAAGRVSWCANNTGNESVDHLWGETICATDGTIAEAATNAATPEVQPFVVGNPQFAMMDNIAYQPRRGNWVIHEDGDGPILTPPRNNDLWDCLPDGADDDTLTDGCIRVASINDLEGNEGDGAEWTGGVFDATGTHFFVSVQHNVTGQGVVLDITGWK